MIELSLNRIKVDDVRHEHTIIFKEKDGDRFLPIVIGESEMTAIKIHLSQFKPPRPLTHDLFLNTISHLKAKLKSISIDRLENSTFFAKIWLETESGELVSIDARPSDSIALALRGEVPVYSNQDVLSQAGVLQV